MQGDAEERGEPRKVQSRQKSKKKEERQADADGTRRQRSDLDAHEAPPARYARNSEKGGR
jgi:hypothetical protein